MGRDGTGVRRRRQAVLQERPGFLEPSLFPDEHSAKRVDLGCRRTVLEKAEPGLIQDALGFSEGPPSGHESRNQNSRFGVPPGSNPSRAQDAGRIVLALLHVSQLETNGCAVTLCEEVL